MPNTPTYLRKPYAALLAQVLKGTLAHAVDYKSADKAGFLRACRENPNHVVQCKYDGWWAAVTPNGLYSKTGRLVTTEIKSNPGQIHVGEYLYGTNWAQGHPQKGMVIVHGSTTGEKGQLPTGCTWVDSYQTSMALSAGIDRLARDFEGLVLKDPITGDFLRWKKEFTGDYVLLECIKSTAKTLEGWACGSIRVGLVDKYGKVTTTMTAGGMDHEMKKDMYDNPKKYVGQVVEITGKQIFTTGKMRHPQFKRIRKDKWVGRCTIEQFKGII